MGIVLPYKIIKDAREKCVLDRMCVGSYAYRWKSLSRFCEGIS